MPKFTQRCSYFPLSKNIFYTSKIFFFWTQDLQMGCYKNNLAHKYLFVNFNSIKTSRGNIFNVNRNTFERVLLRLKYSTFCILQHSKWYLRLYARAAILLLRWRKKLNFRLALLCFVAFCSCSWWASSSCTTSSRTRLQAASVARRFWKS